MQCLSFSYTEGGREGGTKSSLPFKGGHENVYPVFRRGAKENGPAIFHFGAPPSQSLMTSPCLMADAGHCHESHTLVINWSLSACLPRSISCKHTSGYLNKIMVGECILVFQAIDIIQYMSAILDF